MHQKLLTFLGLKRSGVLRKGRSVRPGKVAYIHHLRGGATKNINASLYHFDTRHLKSYKIASLILKSHSNPIAPRHEATETRF
jgi:hypothetical protein